MGGKYGNGHRIFTPNQSVLTFRDPNLWAKFHQNRIKTVIVEAQTESEIQKDTSSFIICPMLCYSNVTDNKDNKHNNETWL